MQISGHFRFKEIKIRSQQNFNQLRRKQRGPSNPWLRYSPNGHLRNT